MYFMLYFRYKNIGQCEEAYKRSQKIHRTGTARPESEIPGSATVTLKYQFYVIFWNKNKWFM